MKQHNDKQAQQQAQAQQLKGVKDKSDNEALKASIDEKLKYINKPIKK